jgi:hypothetical protein
MLGKQPTFLCSAPGRIQTPKAALLLGHPGSPAGKVPDSSVTPAYKQGNESSASLNSCRASQQKRSLGGAGPDGSCL